MFADVLTLSGIVENLGALPLPRVIDLLRKT
jgi:hypothetical protein